MIAEVGTFVTVDWAKIAKLPEVPSATGAGPRPAITLVLKLQA